jgi:hypothetical protein
LNVKLPPRAGKEFLDTKSSVTAISYSFILD